MKKTVIVSLFVMFTALNVYSQYGEYKYFSFKAGITHSLFNSQPEMNVNKFAITPIGSMQLIPDSTYFSYVPGYFASLVFNYDLQNDNTGFMVGASFENFGLASKYHMAVGDRWVSDTYNVNRLSFPVLFKIGRKIYKEQKYFFIGASYDMNLSLYKTESSSWNSIIKKVKLDKSMLVNNNYSIIGGFNFMFFNFQANYVLGSYLNKNYEVSLPNKQTTRPFTTYPRGLFLFQTSINVPINSWTTRKVYEIEVWFRKVFK